MSMRAIACRTCRGVLAAVLALVLDGCDVLSAPPVPDWPDGRRSLGRFRPSTRGRSRETP